MSEIIDEVLEIFQDTAPEFSGGLSNHGPMAAEAMIALGRSEESVSWAKKYRSRLKEPLPEIDRINKENWQSALGDRSRSSDWVRFFEEELKEDSWIEVLNRWTKALSPGMMGAGTHGVIRTAHAVRSMSAAVTKPRMQELAQGLAYWACSNLSLPTLESESAGLTPQQAVATIEPIAAEARSGFRLITDGMAALPASFASVINLVDFTPDYSVFLSELTETFCGVYLANAQKTGMIITFIHSVTAPSALRLIAPFVSAETLHTALRHGWQSAAALYAVYGTAPSPASAYESSISAEDLTDRAIASADEHAVKFTEACLREHRLNPKPVYLVAACHASQMLRTKTDTSRNC